jgi:hypothetical protein
MALFAISRVIIKEYRRRKAVLDQLRQTDLYRLIQLFRNLNRRLDHLLDNIIAAQRKLREEFVETQRKLFDKLTAAQCQTNLTAEQQVAGQMAALVQQHDRQSVAHCRQRDDLVSQHCQRKATIRNAFEQHFDLQFSKLKAKKHELIQQAVAAVQPSET